MEIALPDCQNGGLDSYVSGFVDISAYFNN